MTLVPSGEQTQPISTKTDSKGRWSALGLTSGAWNIDISANGYDVSRGTASVSEVSLVPPIKTELTPAARQEPAPMASAPTPLIPKEAVDAIREGQDLLKIKAGDVVTTGVDLGEQRMHPSLNECVPIDLLEGALDDLHA